MKRIHLIFLIVMLSSIAFGQYTEKRPAGSFDEVSVHGNIKVELIEGDATGIVVYSKENILSDVNTTFEGEKLKISLKRNIFKKTGTVVTVYYTKLREVHAFAGAKIRGMNKIKGDKLTATINAGGSVFLDVNVKKVELKITSGGNLEVAGLANFQESTVSAGGIIETRSLKSSSAIAKIKAGGEIFIWAIDVLDAKVSAGGTIHFKGNPNELNKSVNLGGFIQKVGFSDN